MFVLRAFCFVLFVLFLLEGSSVLGGLTQQQMAGSARLYKLKQMCFSYAVLLLLVLQDYGDSVDSA
jgi:hypothetical protein